MSGDGVVVDICVAITSLLNGECGALDCGACDAMICAVLEAEGFNPDDI